MSTKNKEQTIDINDLHQDAHNFNRGTAEGTRLMDKSFQELGAGRSILLDKDNNIIAGNKSQLAAIRAGIKKVRVIETTGDELVAVRRTDIDINSKKGRELALADNATTQANLSWDDAELASVADELGQDFDTSAWGLDPNDFQASKPTIPDASETKEDDFDPDTAQPEPMVHPGDLYQLGNHILMCGDSTKQRDVATIMNGNLADMWLTDPPYGVDYTGGTKDHLKIMNDRFEGDAFVAFLSSAFNAAEAVLKPGAAFYIWHPSGPKQMIFYEALEKTQLKCRQQLIWKKNALVIGHNDYQYIHEPCLYGWKDGKHYFIPVRNKTTVIEDAEELDLDKMTKQQMHDLLKTIYESHIPTTVICENKPQRAGLHPTMKPIRLFAQLIVNSSLPGQFVLDTFGGSGTTLIACEQLQRRCRMMELDPHYCDVIIKRWEDFTNKKAAFIRNVY